jgi:S-formylglutathione hydrolase
MKRIEAHASFGGSQEVWSHAADALGCEMKFAIYLPERALRGEKCPVLYWLSGLTCTEQNFITKAGAQEHAARHGLIVVAPDTSPRGAGVADDTSYDLGQGAGFYVNATEEPWAKNYRMQEYVASELPRLIESSFAAAPVRGIFGHSMGGHGALVTALRNPDRYASVSAFSPIVAPSQVPWGQKAFSAYLGSDRATWKDWDTIELLKQSATGVRLLVDQGGADEFLDTQLRPQLLREACDARGHDLKLRIREGYDHSYYFVATFLGEHFAYHAALLDAAA